MNSGRRKIKNVLGPGQARRKGGKKNKKENERPTEGERKKKKPRLRSGKILEGATRWHFKRKIKTTEKALLANMNSKRNAEIRGVRMYSKRKSHRQAKGVLKGGGDMALGAELKRTYTRHVVSKELQVTITIDNASCKRENRWCEKKVVALNSRGKIVHVKRHVFCRKGKRRGKPEYC